MNQHFNKNLTFVSMNIFLVKGCKLNTYFVLIFHPFGKVGFWQIMSIFINYQLIFVFQSLRHFINKDYK